jgi:hypothetical protein
MDISRRDLRKQDDQKTESTDDIQAPVHQGENDWIVMHLTPRSEKPDAFSPCAGFASCRSIRMMSFAPTSMKLFPERPSVFLSYLPVRLKNLSFSAVDIPRTEPDRVAGHCVIVQLFQSPVK